MARSPSDNTKEHHMNCKITLIITIIVTLVFARPLDAQTSNGLVAYYPLNGDAIDASGNGHDGTAGFCASAVDRNERPDQALLFDGTRSKVIVRDSPLLRLAYTDYTIAAWVYETQRAANGNCIVSKRGVGHPDGWTLSIAGQSQAPNGLTGRLWYALSGGNDPYYHSRAQLALNQWHHVALVYRIPTGSLQFFIDSVLDSAFDGVATPNANTAASLCIGVDSSQTNAYFFHGAIDELRIYSRALSESEIQQLYAFETPPLATLKRAVQPSFVQLSPGANYQLQVSADLGTWTNFSSVFTATNSSMDYPHYWDVENWQQLYFRVQVAR